MDRGADPSYMDISSIALQGLQQADAQMESAASAIAGAGVLDNGAGVDVVSLSAEMVALMSGQVESEANIAALSAADQMELTLINVTA